MTPQAVSRLAGRAVLTAAIAILALAPQVAAGAGAARPASAPSDTTLAVVGDHRLIGVQSFRGAWSQVGPPVRGASLTPAAAGRFLELLIDREALAERALRDAPAPGPRDSAQAAGIRDRMAMRIALDSALAVLRHDRAARGEPPLEMEPLGVALRESTVVRLAPSYDSLGLARLARAFAALPRPSADSSLASRLRADAPLPALETADSGLVLVRSAAGEYTRGELLAAWAKLPPLYRPRIETSEQVRELVDNGLFDRALRREIERHHYDRDPRVQATIDRQREYQAVQTFLASEIYARIPADSVTLRRFYARAPATWRRPMRLRVASLVLPGRSEAARMAVLLRDAAQAESLVSRGRRQRVDYTAELTAEADSARFASGLRAGTGAVLGPDSTETGWQVTRVLAAIPARQPSFAEVREQVAQAWTAEEGERRLKLLLANLRKQTRVRINQPALEKLVSAEPRAEK